MRLVVAVIVKNREVLSIGDNLHECLREGYPTGQGYELCKGCDYPNHAEAKALWDAIEPEGATLYLFGHTYACEPCKEACAKAGVTINLPL